ncbi:MAG: hypothetical protein IPL43_00400 [Micropruina sp.]|nr:hypothetical protein [Micropruina sp.]
MDEEAITTYRALIDQGLTHREVRQLVRRGEAQRIRHGGYLLGPAAIPATPDQVHRRLALATWSELAEGAVLSHYSAAVLHGLPLLGEGLDRAWVTRASGGHGRRDSVLHLRRCPLGPDEVTQAQGVQVTTPSRTVIDLARTASFEQAVVVADAALRIGVTYQDLADGLERAKGLPGVGQARRVLAFADGRAESPWESISRVRMAQVGLPAPQLQCVIRTAGGEFVARGDFGWTAERTIGEFDGKVKYADLLKPGQTAADVVIREKRREGQIRAQGWWPVRWGAAELANPQRFERLIRNAFAASLGRAA